MAISPQDRNKVIGLVTGVVVVFAFAFWRIQSSLAPTTPPTPPPVVMGGPTPVGGQTTTQTPQQIVEIVLPVSAGRVNPFRTVLSSESVARPANADTVKSVDRSNDIPTGIDRQIGVRPFNPGPVPAEASLEPRLVGIMGGSKPLAVFQVGGKEEIVKVGEKLSNGYTLETVLGDMVIVDKRGAKLRLNMVSPK
jgi:type II secretory pathway component PulC